MSAIVVATTVGDEEQALLIARELVARRLAACVNVVPGVRSVYRWRNKICRDGELLLLIKTMREEYAAVAAAIAELHQYEVPEILAFDIGRGDERFLAWIRDSVDKSQLAGDEEEEDETVPNLDDTGF